MIPDVCALEKSMTCMNLENYLKNEGVIPPDYDPNEQGISLLTSPTTTEQNPKKQFLEILKRASDWNIESKRNVRYAK